MTLRKMSMADYDAVFALWNACEELELNDADDSPEGIARFLNRNPETCFVAEEGGRLLGVLLAGCDGRRGYIYHAAVLPEARGKGVGSALVEAAIARLREMGISKAGLLTFADNAEGSRFWNERGFTPREDLVYHSNVIREVRRIGKIR